MCLEGAFRNPLPEYADDGPRIAYKLLRHQDIPKYTGSFASSPRRKQYVTPFIGIRVRDRVLKAYGEPQFGFSAITGRSDRLGGGAIHCYMYLADVHVGLGEDIAVFEVRGTGYVAHNHYHVAFREVEFLRRVL